MPTIKNKALPNSKPKQRSAAPKNTRSLPAAPAYFLSLKNVYARKGPLVVRLHKDGYFRRHDTLPKRFCTPMGPTRVHTNDRNELRRGLFLTTVKS